jgi:hypothetical protein
MPSAMAIIVDASLAGLMIALIVYCVKLNRRLAAIRDNDADIRQMIVELRNASDRADAATHVLKSAGIEAERSLRAEILRAEAVRHDLGAALDRHAAPPSRIRRQPGAFPGAMPVAERTSADPFDDDLYPKGSPRHVAAPASRRAPTTRHAAEKELLKAIRIARAEG